ncbi:cytochrome P450 716B2-like isoform X3 [Chiloscyllium plagiosum]|uniref:cytochrome P450 716B2-like isoform X3 n=1 Tax=Chiloscyllium plagiosum TaxID=36176 RepID=UPI001CB8869F|nr:cytochrome P450 716B2-like isoform X3 [Chiloscyllium plagiosum]
MSQIRIPGTSGYALMSDKSLEFYKDPMHFCNSRIHSYGSRVFQARLLNKPTIFVCSVKGMKELLCARMSVFEKDPSAVMHELYGGNLVTTDEQVNVFDTSYTTSMCKLFGDTVCFTNGEEAQLLRLSLMQLFRGKAIDTYADYINRVCIRNLKDLALSSEPVAVYAMFKRLATELVLGIFLNVDAEESAALSKQITQLSTQHWHGLISAPVKVKVSVWSSAFTQALEAKGKLLNIINERLKSEEDGLISKIKTIPFPENTSAAQHLLLFISALIPKAVASLLTSFTVELAGSDKTDLRKRAQESEDYLNHVLLEVERLWPSFIGGRRIAKQDTTLCGYVVPKGYLALFVAFAVHRDPEIFDDPDEFQPERWSGRQQLGICSIITAGNWTLPIKTWNTNGFLSPDLLKTLKLSSRHVPAKLSSLHQLLLKSLIVQRVICQRTV